MKKSDYRSYVSMVYNINSVDKKMDYPRLYNQLPKEPIKWTVSDMETWLQFIGLASLSGKFKQLSIDGSCLSSLTQEDLREELGVKSGITVKKIMSWITKGLREYEEFLKSPIVKENQAEYFSNQVRDITQKAKINKSNPMLGQGDMFKNLSGKGIPIDQPIIFQNNPGLNLANMPISNPSQIPILHKIVPEEEEVKIIEKNAEEIMMENEEDRNKEYELIIQQYDGPQTSFYSVKEDGAKIGRHSSNQILILDESISRFHAEIKFKDGNFYLRDTGSTTGTFIKILEKMEIQQETIIEMGSNQFQAHFIDNMLSLEVIEGPSQGAIYQIPKNTKVTIGRKSTNHINFTDDQHLSNLHATIFCIENNYYLQDMGTTNGSWKRLSLQGESSNYEQLDDKMVFKFGANQTYCCKIKTAFVVDETIPNACIICYENDKDCVYLPCKHNTACIRCSRNLRECPICRTKIQDLVRIYKS